MRRQYRAAKQQRSISQASTNPYRNDGMMYYSLPPLPNQIQVPPPPTHIPPPPPRQINQMGTQMVQDDISHLTLGTNYG